MIGKTQRPIITAVIQAKGGVAKTTGTCCLSYALSAGSAKLNEDARGQWQLGRPFAPQPTLIVDTDSQQEVSWNLGLDIKSPGLADAIFEDDPEMVLECIQQPREGLPMYVLPAGKDMHSLKMELAGESDEVVDNVMRRFLAPVMDQDDVPLSHIIIDTAPSLDSLTPAILSCMDLCIVPVKMEGSAVHGLMRIEEVLEALGKQIDMIIPMDVDGRDSGRTRTYRQALVYHEKYSRMILVEGIGHSSVLAQGTSRGQLVMEVAPDKNTAYDFALAAVQYIKRVAKWKEKNNG